ncbi:MAG: type II toxin-antitoxin system VapB family antitoxin [Candidatus Freyarchaeota archaeon]
MSVPVSFRFPKKLKERMDVFKGRVNWSEEVRRFVEARVAELEKKELLEKIDLIIKDLPELPHGTVVKLLRDDRDSH